MRKHAFLIGVFKNPDYLEALINSLDSDRSNFYIHINRSYRNVFVDVIEKLKYKSNVHFFSCVSYKWGGTLGLKFNQILLDAALKDEENFFFHHLSGQDILIKPLRKLFAFFDDNYQFNYIDYGEWESNPWRKNGGLEIERYSLYNILDIVDVRDHPRFVSFVHRFREIQRFFKIQRDPWPFEKLYWGYCWWSLNRKGAEEIHNFLNVKRNWRYLKYTFAPEEAIYQDILLNSDISHTVVNNSLRYIDWSVIDGGSPKTLTEEDFSNLIESNAFFARKVDPLGRSKKLIDMLISFCEKK